MLAKGKAHKRYEFGVKVSIAATNKSNFVVGAMALSGNPYEHTLSGALEQVRRMSGQRIDEVFVDRGYRGHGESAKKCIFPVRSEASPRNGKAKPETSTGDSLLVEERWIAGSQLSQRHTR